MRRALLLAVTACTFCILATAADAHGLSHARAHRVILRVEHRYFPAARLRVYGCHTLHDRNVRCVLAITASFGEVVEEGGGLPTVRRPLPVQTVRVEDDAVLRHGRVHVVPVVSR